jgi:hypothetical protein
MFAAFQLILADVSGPCHISRAVGGRKAGSLPLTSVGMAIWLQVCDPLRSRLLRRYPGKRKKASRPPFHVNIQNPIRPCFRRKLERPASSKRSNDGRIRPSPRFLYRDGVQAFLPIYRIYPPQPKVRTRGRAGAEGSANELGRRRKGRRRCALGKDAGRQEYVSFCVPAWLACTQGERNDSKLTLSLDLPSNLASFRLLFL